MATWTPATKNASTFTNASKSTTIPIGSSMGLLLALTYATPIPTTGGGDAPVWSRETKN